MECNIKNNKQKNKETKTNSAVIAHWMKVGVGRITAWKVLSCYFQGPVIPVKDTNQPLWIVLYLTGISLRVISY